MSMDTAGSFLVGAIGAAAMTAGMTFARVGNDPVKLCRRNKWAAS
jgi:hypothetical protein